jgi:hypothetical protein
MRLKALAHKVLERNRACNSGATEQLQGVQLRPVEAQPKLQPKERPVPGEWSEVEWRVYYDERAGIAEFDGEMSREKAEAQAYECSISEWLIQHPPAANSPNRCAHCSETLTEREALPFLCGTDGGHVWMHGKCHAEWMAAQIVAVRTAVQN